MVRTGIICPSEIALRRFMPAMKGLSGFQFAGIAYASKIDWPGANDDTIQEERKKAEQFTVAYGGVIYESYNSIIQANDIDAIYIPLPPALHFQWAEKALAAGKHVLVEKPATTSLAETTKLVELAAKKNLALHENYMFAFHGQLNAINKIIQSGEIGDVRLYRISFGFPRRQVNDFRYNKALGGGAILDAGGYTIKYASMLLGKSAKLLYSNSQYIDEFEVDIAGSAAMVNLKGTVAQIAFGMDHSYKCDLEVWGSKGSLHTGRVLTAPAGFEPEIKIQIGNNTELRKLPEDDAFQKSILHFKNCIENDASRENNYSDIKQQATLVQQFIDNTHL
jgi:dTDP-3,4-didehydro-2,6-dideoxy-alpha-D-glucose 3-reductase